MDKERIVSSTQEQASSAWVGWLNQIRLNELFEKLSTQNGNLAEVMASMDDAMKSINNLIITNRGGRPGHSWLHCRSSGNRIGKRQKPSTWRPRCMRVDQR